MSLTALQCPRGYRSSAWDRALVWFSAALVVSLLAVSSRAAAEDPPPPRRRVAVAAVSNFAPPIESLFTRPKSAARTVESELEALVLSRLAAEPDLEVISPDALRQRVRGLRLFGDVSTALDTKKQGEKLYRDLNTEAAIPVLEQAESALTTAYFDIVDPTALADLALTEALAYVEQRDDIRIHSALKRMFWLDPTRSFPRGFYPDTFEHRITSAFTDFRDNSQKENPLGSQRRLDQFLADVDVDTLIYVWLEASPTPGSVALLRLSIYDSTMSTVSFQYPVRPAASPAAKAHVDRLDRFLTNWLTCLPKYSPVAATSPTDRMRRFFIDTGFAYSVFTLNDATREPFHNLGVGFYTEYQFLAGLGAYLRVDLFSSIRDPIRDLLDNVTSARVGLGLTYAFQGKWWRLAPHFGLEVQFLGTLQTTTLAWCKFQSIDSAQCVDKGGVETDLSGAITTGPSVGLSAQFFASRNFYIGLRASVSIFIAPFSKVDDLNIPFTSELSLGYTY